MVGETTELNVLETAWQENPRLPSEPLKHQQYTEQVQRVKAYSYGIKSTDHGSQWNQNWCFIYWLSISYTWVPPTSPR